MGYKSIAKKYAKKATKAVGKRYGISYGRRGLRMGSHSLPKIIKDVKEIKSRLNVEKKYIEGSLTSGLVAQIAGNDPGYFTSNITPLIFPGTSENQRVGGSIKLTGLHMKYQFQGQSDCYQGRVMKIHIVKSTDSSVTNVINDVWDANPLTGLRDYYSNRNYSNNPKAHQVLKTQYVKLPQKQVLAGSIAGFNSQKHTNVGMKMQQITRFEGSGTQPKDCYYWVIMFCDGGNFASVNTSNQGVMTPEDNSGVNVQEYFRWWYVDN